MILAFCVYLSYGIPDVEVITAEKYKQLDKVKGKWDKYDEVINYYNYLKYFTPFLNIL